MLPFAPITRLTDWLTASPLRELYRVRASYHGLEVLAVARKEVGHGEAGGNNQGADLRRYRGGLGGKKSKASWCAAFVFFCLLTASQRGGWRLKIKRTHGARKLFRRVVAAGMLVELEDVQPGDIVLWSRGPLGSWKAHIGIVSRVQRDEAGKVVRWWYIAGNEGHFPALVDEHEGTHRKRLVGFARLP